MSVIPPIPRFQIDFVTPTESRPMRTNDSFQIQFDRKLDSSKSSIEKPIDRSSKPPVEGTKINETGQEQSERAESVSIDQTDDSDQAEKSAVGESGALSVVQKAKSETASEADQLGARPDDEKEVGRSEMEEAALVELARLATVANQQTPQIGEHSASIPDAVDSTQDQQATNSHPVQVIASTASAQIAKSIESTKQAEKSERAIELPAFQPIETGEQFEAGESKQESRENAKTFDEAITKQQMKLEAEATKPTIDHPKSDQTEPIKMALDSIQSKSGESSMKVANPHVAARNPDVARSNVENIVSSVRAQLLPRGGAMQMRLDPPELGALAISLKLVDGRMTASFTTENAEAARMISHNLGQLKSALEAGGVQVHRLDVKTSAESLSQSRDDESGRNQQKQSEGSWQQSEQQRREMVNRMWRRYAYGSDELDLVA